jgi:hypothetical protein
MQIHNLYVDAQGNSHFRDMEIEWMPDDRTGGRVSKPLPGGLVIHEHSGNYEIPRRAAPRRQYVLGLTEAFEVETSDDAIHRIPVGDLVLVEDVSGPGHTTRSVGGGTPRYTLIFPLCSGCGARLMMSLRRLWPRSR